MMSSNFDFRVSLPLLPLHPNINDITQQQRSVKQPRSDPLRFGCRVPLPARHPHVTFIDQRNLFPTLVTPALWGFACPVFVATPSMLGGYGCAVAALQHPPLPLINGYRGDSGRHRARVERQQSADSRQPVSHSSGGSAMPPSLPSLPVSVDGDRGICAAWPDGVNPFSLEGLHRQGHRRYKEDLSRTEEWSTEASFAAEDESVQALGENESDDVELFDDFRAFPPPAVYSRAASWEDQASGTTSRTTTPVAVCTSADPAPATVGERYLPDHGRRIAGILAQFERGTILRRLGVEGSLSDEALAVADIVLERSVADALTVDLEVSSRTDPSPPSSLSPLPAEAAALTRWSSLTPSLKNVYLYPGIDWLLAFVKRGAIARHSPRLPRRVWLHRLADTSNGFDEDIFTPTEQLITHTEPEYHGVVAASDDAAATTSVIADIPLLPASPVLLPTVPLPLLRLAAAQPQLSCSSMQLKGRKPTAGSSPRTRDALPPIVAAPPQPPHLAGQLKGRKTVSKH
jgi:hypothetical protein